MRKLILTSLATLLSITLIFLFLRSNPGATQSEYVPQEDYVPDEVLVKFEKEVSKYDIQDAINSVQGKIITYQNKEISPFQWDPSLSSHKSFYLDNDLFHLKVPEAVGTEQAIFVLRQIPYVKYAEMNGIIRASRTPNDPDFNLLWGLHNTGQSEGTADADIDAPEAWDIFTGSSDIVVAVIDSGVDYNHEDLAANVWINWDEYYGTPNVDDNDPPNGYVDDIYGYDFVNDDDHDPMDDWDPIYHGTHVAGTLGAVGNNGKGVTGVNWNVKIMCLKILNSAGSGSWGDAIHAIKYATANGAHLSNNSWDNGTYYSEAMYDAIEEAKDAGKLFIAAAGNYPKRPWYNNDEIPNYPANYDLDNIIAVLSTDHNDNRSSFSHFGAISVDIGAPGGSGTGSVEDIYSTKRGNAYQYMAGTSMAAPHVAGAAALVWGHRPNLSWDEVKSVLMYGADRIGSVSGLAVSDGRLNVYKALISQPGDPPTAPSMLTAIARFTTVRLRWNDNSDNEQGFKIFRKSDLHPYWQMIDRVGPNIRSYQDTGLPCNKTFWYKVCAYNGYGNSSFSNVAEAETICLY